MKVTYVQIHEDNVKDLLVEQSTPRLPSITLREHATKGVYMDNAKYRPNHQPALHALILVIARTHTSKILRQ